MKLIDGPLEGKTLAAAFLANGEPQGRITIPANGRGTRYIYRRDQTSEFAEGTGIPSAVDYRYLGADFD